jgi:hypothetical protein
VGCVSYVPDLPKWFRVSGDWRISSNWAVVNCIWRGRAALKTRLVKRLSR